MSCHYEYLPISETDDVIITIIHCLEENNI